MTVLVVNPIHELQGNPMMLRLRQGLSGVVTGPERSSPTRPLPMIVVVFRATKIGFQSLRRAGCRGIAFARGSG